MNTTNIHGTATIEEGGRSGPIVITDGPCLTSTIDRLVAGYAPAKPLSPETVEVIREQAVALIGDVVGAYESCVAVGEVGQGGSGRASPELAQSLPTGLLYGRIQSGKTNAMILAAAAAIDNGFRTILVLTSDNVELVKQTARRFRVLDSVPLVYASTSNEWLEEAENIRKQLGPHGVILVCSKNKDQLPNLYRILVEIGASEYPALIFDDEADQATLDTTTQARALGRTNAPADASTTYRRVVQNTAPDEQGQSLRELLRHHIFVQVTATPYALLLQNTESPLRPTFTKLLDPGTGYNGGEDFFSDEHLDDEKPPIVYVSPTDSDLARVPAGTWAPDGLARAIAFFLLSASAIERIKKRSEPEGYKFLCHTSSQRQEHDRFTEALRSHVNGLIDEKQELQARQDPAFTWAYENLRGTLTDVPPLEALMEHLKRRLHHRRFLTINSDRGPGEYGSSFNFLIGGNILGRGLTIDNLLVTYYMRMPKTTQMDTMLQHARMFGYRGDLMPFTRVFLPPILAARFAQITASEIALRELLAAQDPRSPIPVHVIGGLRPTRTNVLDPDRVGGIRAGQQVYPRIPAYEPGEMGTWRERIEQRICEVTGVGDWRDACGDNYWPCTIDELVKFVETVRTGDPEGGEWNKEALANVLRSIAAQYDNAGFVLVRTFKTPRRKHPILNGGIGGDEQEAARAKGRPVLHLLWHDGSRPFAGEPFWYPSLVFPRTMANQVFNVT